MNAKTMRVTDTQARASTDTAHLISGLSARKRHDVVTSGSVLLISCFTSCATFLSISSFSNAPIINSDIDAHTTMPQIQKKQHKRKTTLWLRCDGFSEHKAACYLQ